MSLPLDGRRGFAGYIVGDAGDAGHFVDDAPRDEIEELVGQVRPAGRHEIHRLHRAQGDHERIAAPVAGDAHGFHRQEYRERLADGVVEIMAAQLLDEDVVGEAKALNEPLPSIFSPK